MNSDDVYFQALLARDPRFDGKFFVGVKTTGIYCRPICPAKPQRKNVEFFESAVLAEKSGYRPCLRCRPEAAPLSPAWNGTSALVQRVVRTILDGGISGTFDDHFASRFGVTSRHIRRLFTNEIGKTPKQFHQDQRLSLAKTMVIQTRLPITEIAYASGFQSLRRFHHAFQSRFLKPPTQLRKSTLASDKQSEENTFFLSYRPPFHFSSLLSYLKRHELFSVEEISSTKYVRYYKTQTGVCKIQIQNKPSKSALSVTIHGFDKDNFYGIIQGIRRLFDLSADPLLISNIFEKSPFLHSLSEMYPGIRSPGSIDPFETAILVILGQLVSSKQANRLASQLLIHYGEPYEFEGKTMFSFPSPQKLASCDLLQLATTQKRRDSIRCLSQMVESNQMDLRSHQDPSLVKKQLLQIPGIGPWTAEYIGMRCLQDPDSFPKSDLILQKAVRREPSIQLDNVRPFRSYAAYLLWEFFGIQDRLNLITPKTDKGTLS